MPPVISVVGPSKSGKTTLLTAMVAELKRRGWRAAVIKHSACALDVDREGKDSRRHARAGAEAVIVSAPKQWAMFCNVSGEEPLSSLCARLPAVDIVFTEGFRRAATPKIEIVPPGEKVLSAKNELLALVCDEKKRQGVPSFTRDEALRIAAWLEESFLLSSP